MLQPENLIKFFKFSSAKAKKTYAYELFPFTGTCCFHIILDDMMGYTRNHTIRHRGSMSMYMLRLFLDIHSLRPKSYAYEWMDGPIKAKHGKVLKNCTQHFSEEKKAIRKRKLFHSRHLTSARLPSIHIQMRSRNEDKKGKLLPLTPLYFDYVKARLYFPKIFNDILATGHVKSSNFSPTRIKNQLLLCFKIS